MEQEKLTALVKKAQAGDAAALEQLLTYAHTPVSYQCRKFMNTPEDAEDMTQEVLMVIYQKLDTLTDPAAFNGWVKRIAATRCMNAVSRTHIDLQFAEDEDGNSFVDTIEELDKQKIPDAALDDAETARMVVELIDALPEAQRICTYLYYYDELSIKEIAELTAATENTVKSRLNYARKAIKEGVLDHEKKGIKLYGLSPLPFLWYFLRMAAQTEANEAAAAACVTNVMAANTAVAGTATAVTASAAQAATAAATAGGASAATGAGLLAKIIGLPLVIKVTAAVAAVALAAGIGGAILNMDQDAEPVISQQTEPTATSITVTEPTVTGTSVTAPAEEETDVTEPLSTESTATQPAETNPEETEPKATEPEAAEPEVTVYYVPEGCTYIMADGTVLGAGDAIPSACADGDRLICADYIYKYGYEYGERSNVYDDDGNAILGPAFYDSDIEGWGVCVKDMNKTSYSTLLSEINGMPVLSLQYTFFHCTEMTEAPAIPGSVTNLSQTFYCCYSLAAAPEIPEGVTNMADTFYECGSLVEAPALPSTVVNLSWTFGECTALTTAPAIPESVRYMEGTFCGCSALTGIIEINATPTSYTECFAATKAPIVLTGSGKVLAELAATSANGNVTVFGANEPSTTMYYVPEGCTYTTADGTELQAGEAMPTVCSVGDKFTTDAYTYVYGKEYGEGEFYDNNGNFLGVGFGFLDTGIEGWSVIVKDQSQTSYPALLAEINGAPLVSMKSTFRMCKNMTEAPAIPSSVTNMHETFAGCYRLTAAPVIPESVTNMSYTFAGCESLTGTVEINADLSAGYFECFAGTRNPITLTGSSKVLAEVAATSENGNVTVK